jgi:hypothetical protein
MWNGLGSKPSLHSDALATKHLCHSTAQPSKLRKNKTFLSAQPRRVKIEAPKAHTSKTHLPK